MGVLWAAMGIFLVFSKKIGVELDMLPSPYTYIFGGLCLVYGGFRIYRGIKKNYFN